MTFSGRASKPSTVSCRPSIRLIKFARSTCCCQAGYEQHSHGTVRVDPITEARRPRIPDSDVKPPTSQQFRKLVATTANAQHRLMSNLASSLGVRRGEFAALRWSAIDLDYARSRSINRFWTRKASLTERFTRNGHSGHRTFHHRPHSSQPRIDSSSRLAHANTFLSLASRHISVTSFDEFPGVSVGS